MEKRDDQSTIITADYPSSESMFTCAAEIKHALIFTSRSNIFSDNSNPFICGMLMSVKSKS